MVYLSLLTSWYCLIISRYYSVSRNITIFLFDTICIIILFGLSLLFFKSGVIMICMRIIFFPLFIVCLILLILIFHIWVIPNLPYIMNSINIPSMLVFYKKIQSKRSNQASDNYSFILFPDSFKYIFIRLHPWSIF